MSRILLSILIALAFLTSSFSFIQLNANAAILDDFDPGNLIVDSKFYTSGELSASEIQTFLNEKGANCVSKPSSNSYCLKDYKMTTPTVTANKYCKKYTGASNESAAKIISKMAKNCNVSEKVILVILQKEQSLITTASPIYVDPNGKHSNDGWGYRAAMGFGCPDGGSCDSKYYGLFNQLDQAVWQLVAYTAGDYKYSYAVGNTYSLKYHPDTTCGSKKVTIKNKATAALYNYTPYQPNSYALAAGWGSSANRCASYGNRNFYLYYNNWFGTSKYIYSDITKLTVDRTDAIEWLSGQNITAGCNDQNTKYCPGTVVNRGSMAIFLLKLSGQTVSKRANSLYFADVSSTDTEITYQGAEKSTTLKALSQSRVYAIDWLYEQKISAGSGETTKGLITYRPQDAVTRGSMAIFLQKFLLFENEKTDSSQFADVFSGTEAKTITYLVDSKKVKELVQPSSEARIGAINWLYENGITGGSGETSKNLATFRPQDAVNRGSMAVFLQRLYLAYMS